LHSQTIHINYSVRKGVSGSEIYSGRSYNPEGLKTGVIIHCCIKRKKFFKGTGKTITGIKYNVVLVDCKRSNIYCLAWHETNLIQNRIKKWLKIKYFSV
jgi:hypothetical protein